MIFENLWPLAFLAAVPIIIILYLLKPKGEDHLISSNLLWQKLLKNEQSKTFFEKFVHNILMYLQILTVMLLVVALMSQRGQAAEEGYCFSIPAQVCSIGRMQGRPAWRRLWRMPAIM